MERLTGGSHSGRRTVSSDTSECSGSSATPTPARTRHSIQAAALKERTSELVEGGWERGVLARVVHYDVRAVT